MKLIIDIPDHVYEHAKNMSEDGNDEYEALRAIAKGEKTLVDISLLVQKVIEILPDVVDSVVDNIPTYINEKLKCQNCDWYKEQRPHGEWKPDGTCSECGVYSSLNKDTTYFCPNCGASMPANDEQVTGKLKEGEDKKSCLNCGSSECELGNRARYGFCGNWTMREGEAE